MNGGLPPINDRSFNLPRSASRNVARCPSRSVRPFHRSPNPRSLREAKRRLRNRRPSGPSRASHPPRSWRKATGRSPSSGTRRLLAQPLVETGDLFHPATAVDVLQAGDLVQRPVKVVSDEGYLLVESIEGVAANPPRPSTSSWKRCSHCGQTAVTRSGSSALIRLYASCR